jgi:nucleoside-diphosphate-sugar epimerase
MRILVAGATGAVGRPLVRQLVAAGHEVLGTTRSSDRMDRVRNLGAEAVVLDASETSAIGPAVRKAEPEIVINQLTELPDKIDLKKAAESLAPTTKLRAEAGPALVEAAREVGARRVISQSIAFNYAPEGDWVKAEDAPLRAPADGPPRDPGTGAARLEQATVEAEGIEGVALRYGYFYGPGTFFDPDGSTYADVKARRYPIVGKGTGVFSFIHVEDAASATVAALDGPQGIYNVVDDDPAPLAEWLNHYAEVLGAKPPRRVPFWLAKLVGGEMAVRALDLRGADNAKAKRDLGWAPKYPSWREGFRTELG